MLHGWKDDSMLAKPLAACTYLFLTTFLFDAPGAITLCGMDGKRIPCLQIVSQHVPIYLQQFPSYSIRDRKCKKSPFSRTAAHAHFCFPWGCPWGNHAKCCMDGKRIRCLQIASLNVPI